MTQERLNGLNEGLYTLRQLQRQLEQNGESFHRAVSGEIDTVYQEGVTRALQHCRELEALLVRLQQEEQTRSLAGL